MSNPDIVEYIKNCRKAGFGDEQIRLEIAKTGTSPELIDVSFAEIDGFQAAVPTSAPAPKMALWKKIVAGTIGLGVPTLIVLVMLSPSRHSGRDGELEKKIAAYKAERWNGNPHLSEFLPKQSPGNAGKDYLSAAKALMTKGYKCGEPIDETLHAEAIAHLETAVLKKDSLIIGNLRPFPKTRNQYVVGIRILKSVSCFTDVFVERSERMANAGDTEGAFAEAKKSIAVGHHLMNEWSTHMQTFGARNIVGGTIRLGLADKMSPPLILQPRLAFVGVDLEANMFDPDVLKMIMKLAPPLADLPGFRGFLEDKQLRHAYAPWVLMHIAMNWSKSEFAESKVNPARRLFLVEAAGHGDSFVAKMAVSHLAILDSYEKELAAMSPSERVAKGEKFKNFWKAFF